MTTLVNLSVFGTILVVYLAASLFVNISMMRYVRRNVSLIAGSRANMRNEVAKTVFAMTLSTACCQIVLITLLFVIISTLTYQSTVTSPEVILIAALLFMVLLNSGTIPVTYIARNARMLKALRCECF